MATIEELKAEVDRLEGDLLIARGAYNDAMKEAHPWKVGDEAESRRYDRDKWVRVRVVDIRLRWGRFITVVAPYNKDGALSKRTWDVDHSPYSGSKIRGIE